MVIGYALSGVSSTRLCTDGISCNRLCTVSGVSCNRLCTEWSELK